MADYLTFGIGLLVASLAWFAFFTFALLQMVLLLHRRIGEQVLDVRQTLVDARSHAPRGNVGAVEGTLGEALDQLDTVMSAEEPE